MEILLIIGFIVLATIFGVKNASIGGTNSSFGGTNESFEERKGSDGERIVSRILESLPETEYTIINDLLLMTNKGTTQIDHVLVSVYGIFVIETKFYNGWITGGENSEYWTENFYGKKYQFRNPILQNDGHCRALKRILYKHNVPVISVVAFSGRATLKVSTETPVLYWDELKSFVQKYSTPVISVFEKDEIVGLLRAQNMSSEEAKRTHKQYVHTTAMKGESQIQKGFCPRCGAPLVLRQGKYGSFYGCSNYPKCKFTYQIHWEDLSR